MFGGGAVLAGMTTMNIGDRNSEFVRRYLALEKIRIVAEDLQGCHPRKVAFMPRTGQVMVKKLRLQQEAGVAEREQALVRQSAEARAERLATARERVELFSTPRPRQAEVELFGSHAGGAAAARAAGRQRSRASNCSAQASARLIQTTPEPQRRRERCAKDQSTVRRRFGADAQPDDGNHQLASRT